MKTTLITSIIGTCLCTYAQTITTGLPVAPAAGNAPHAESRAVGAVTAKIASLSPYRDTVPPVQIRFSPVDAKVAQEMEEDLAVMGALIDQSIDERQTAMGIEMVITSSSVRGMYIEGTGPLYMIKVDFPMFGPASAEEKPEEKPVDSEWERVRDRLRGQNTPNMEYSARSNVRFDPKQVEALKKILLGTMKNGGNFRHFKPDEHLSIAVFGHPSPVRAYVQKSNRDDSSPGKSGNYFVSWSSSKSEQGTVMTLKAKKADIDAFASGKMDLDAFSNKVTVATYSGNGYGMTSVNSWLHGSGSSSTSLRLR